MQTGHATLNINLGYAGLKTCSECLEFTNENVFYRFFQEYQVFNMHECAKYNLKSDNHLHHIIHQVFFLLTCMKFLGKSHNYENIAYKIQATSSAPLWGYTTTMP